jgi:uncharacterized surface anchored protein
MAGSDFEIGGHRGEPHENGGLSEIKFEGLQSGDVVLLETESGSSYRLSVSDNQDKRVTVERSNERDVIGDEETSWERVGPDTLFDLRGSCERMLTGGSVGLKAVNTTEGHFVVGQRAWLGTELDGKDRTLITSNLVSVNLIPSV